MGKQSRLVLGLLLIAGVAAASGGLQGRMSRRWGASSDVEARAKRLQELPGAFGDWELRTSDSIGKETLAELQSFGYVYRTYAHVKSSQTVQVAVLLGPSGPTSVHTPEICFSSRDHSLEGERKKANINSGGQQNEFWTLRFRLNTLEAPTLSVYYGWSTGGPWQAPESPRLTYAGAPFLYKVQLGCYATNAEQGAIKDLPTEFLKAFLPVVTKCLSTER
jgi:hypothetical protein